MAAEIARLAAEDAPRVVACFERVYGATYANELFHDAARLARQMRKGRLCCVGARAEGGRLLGHMAMTRRRGATIPELGNSVVAPEARGRGLIWRIGAELVAWSRELGDEGFLDYPTTAHAVMQRHSLETGCEVGLMLGYIPPETDGGIGRRGSGLRRAATIVYHPHPGVPSEPRASYVPAELADLVQRLAEPSGLARTWKAPPGPKSDAPTRSRLTRLARRGVDRLSVERAGRDLEPALRALTAPCQQIDFAMSDPGIGFGVATARDAGFAFCGWLPGSPRGDVLRLQRVDRARTDLEPELIGRVARALLATLGLRSSAG